jgi:trigger factor
VSPQFTSLNITDGSFKCEFTLYTKPNFDLGKYKGFEIPKPHIDETPEIIAAKMMQELRENAGTSEQFTSDDIVQLGDNIIIDYDCFDGDVMIKEACAQGDIILVGKTSLSEFDNNLIGMKLGEVREFNFSVPENAVSIIKGKVVRFVVTLNSASKTVPHALNDELAQKFASENIDDLTSKINMAASKRYEDSLLVKKIENITGILLEGSNIDVPSWLSLQEAQYLCSSNKGDWNSLTEANKQSLLDAGAKNVKLSLILEKIREEEPDCQLSDEEVVQIIKNNLSKADLKKSVEESLKDLNSGGYLQVLINRARDEHTMQFIINSSTIVE